MGAQQSNDVTPRRSALDNARALYNAAVDTPAHSPHRSTHMKPITRLVYAPSADDSSHPSSLESLVLPVRGRQRQKANVIDIGRRRQTRSLSTSGFGTCPMSARTTCSDTELDATYDDMAHRSSEDDDIATSTSASDDSFEIDVAPTACVSGVDETPKLEPLVEEEEARSSTIATLNRTLGKPSPSILSDSGRETDTNPSESATVERLSRNIDVELATLDTRLPKLDFERLERHLNDAALERDRQQRKLMSEVVRQRLAMGDDDEIENDYLAPSTSSSALPAYVQQHASYMQHPSRHVRKSNLAHRLQMAKELQVCYMNDASRYNNKRIKADTVDFDDEPDDDSLIPKSKSTPAKLSNDAKTPVLSVDDDLSATQLSRRCDATPDAERLERETVYMLEKARDAAHMQVELDRQARRQRSFVEQILGVALNHKLSRAQLSKMGVTQLQLIVNDMHEKIDKLNEHLMRLLMSRDQLHMEQDSLLVDVEDQLKHRARTDLPLQTYLLMSDDRQLRSPIAASKRAISQIFNFHKR